jgi:hypothetical protein
MHRVPMVGAWPVCVGVRAAQRAIEEAVDLLFSVAWRGGGEALVYLLFEHQSTSDGLMAFRMLPYEVPCRDGRSSRHGEFLRPDQRRPGGGEATCVQCGWLGTSGGRAGCLAT